MRAWCALIALMAVACGGGGGTQAGAVAEPPAQGPAVAVAEPPVPAVAPAPAPSWADVWSEGWPALRLAGWVSYDYLRGCAGGAVDPGTAGSFAHGTRPDAWASYGTVDGASVMAGALVVDAWQSQGRGWGLVHGREVDHRVVTRITGVLDLQPDSGAWLQLAAYRGEGDWRGLALYESAGRVRVGWWAPCYWRDLAPVQQGARRLDLTYTPPPAATCWQAAVDGAVVHTEACGHNGAQMDGPWRPSVWAVNLLVEGRQAGMGRVRASVGPITLQQPVGAP